MCCAVIVEEGETEVAQKPDVQGAVDWRGIAFSLARFARHRPECHQHPFDRPCHCGYEEVWAEYKRREREYYLASLEPASAGVTPDTAGRAMEKVCRAARGKEGKLRK